jgi:hypothetical protein
MCDICMCDQEKQAHEQQMEAMERKFLHEFDKQQKLADARIEDIKLASREEAVCVKLFLLPLLLFYKTELLCSHRGRSLLDVVITHASFLALRLFFSFFFLS